MLAGLLAGVDGDDPDRRWLVQGVGGHLSLGLVHDHPHASRLGRSSKRLAISTAAVAASHPLLPCLPPARSSACSRVLVVRTPKVQGTPDSRATCCRPRADSPATYSKWGVSPRITAPRHTTASNCPESASRPAASGSSKAPGVQMTSMSSGTMPSFRNAARAPSTSFSVTTPLKREATTANRRPRPSSVPSRVLMTHPPPRDWTAGAPAFRAWPSDSRCSRPWASSPAGPAP